MPNPTTNKPAPNMETTLKTLWGASRWPGFAESTVVFEQPGAQKALKRLEQMISVQSCGLLHGPHGVGKTYLVHRLIGNLPDKKYRIHRISHSSLMGSDLLRQWVVQCGHKPHFRRGDNFRFIEEHCKQIQPLWPLLIVEEAQNLSAQSLEELRLMTCTSTDTRPPFSLLLIGDEDLLPRLELGINRALLSRLGFCIGLQPWEENALQDYLQSRLEEVGIHANPFEEAAIKLLVSASNGSPRNLNTLLQRSMENAAMEQRRDIQTTDIHAAMDTLPWMARPQP
jgi:type II secretory pathway predicted ATPase ExeA